MIQHHQQRETNELPVTKGKVRYITPRTFVLSTLLLIVSTYWEVQLEVVQNIATSYAVPFWNVIFILFVLTLLNRLVYKYFPRLALSPSELMTVYVMLSVGVAISSTHMLQILVSMMGYAAHFASPENGWDDLFIKDLPSWLIVTDRTSLTNLYSGNSTLFRPENWRPWLVPAAIWSAFTFVLIFTMLCINCILRKHWLESERLTFPSIHLPMEMVRGGDAFWKNRLLWAGFAVAAGITLINGINYMMPSFPALPTKRQPIGQYFVVPPWTALNGTWVTFYPFAIGLSYLIPLDLSFSCWFFFILFKLELVVTMAAGWNQTRIVGAGFDTAYPCTFSQAFGAYMAVCVSIILSSRRYLFKVFRTAFMNSRELDESNEAISYRTAILGSAAGFILLSAFAYLIGMSLWIALVFFLVYFTIAIMVTRIRAEVGFPIHDMHCMSPQYLMTTIMSTESLGKENLAGFSLFFWFNRTYAAHVMPHQLEGFKFAEQTKTSARQLFAAILIAAAVALPISFIAILQSYFHNGAATAKMGIWTLGYGAQVWNQLANWLKQPVPANWTSVSFVGVGFAFASLLAFLRHRFLWFPFHPLAYAVANSWGMAMIWLPLLIGSVAKAVILRTGGRKMYQRYLPFFYGLILGEFIVGGIWTLIGTFSGFPTYLFWP